MWYSIAASRAIKSFGVVAGDNRLYAVACSLLQRVHKAGVLHGNMQCENFVVFEGNLNTLIALVDFGESRTAFTNDDCKRELDELEALFKWL